MDTSDPEIEFDGDGVCNHCRKYERKAHRQLVLGDEGKHRLQAIAAVIKKKGRRKDYDCVLGLSGGVDSSFAAYHVKRLGLRPLLVHLDNGWNTPISNQNIEKIARAFGLDLHTHVIDWEEFKDIQLSYLKASVVDIEVPTDQAIFALLYAAAVKNRVKYIITGTNLATEGVMPLSWVYNKIDLRNLKDIHRRFGRTRLKTFPMFGIGRRLFYEYVLRILQIPVLNYVPYRKEEAKEIIARELGWQDYGGKHYESIFTRFYQAYILPRKFNIDKRRAHLSALICSGQITRDEAMEKLAQPLYSEEELARDREYVLKKLGLSPEEFEEIMRLPARSHLDYRSDVRIRQFVSSLKRKLAGGEAGGSNS
jgi:N-acetyl sugar amidotransferase